MQDASTAAAMQAMATPPRVRHNGQDAHEADESTISLHAASPMLEGVSHDVMNMIPISPSRRLGPTPQTQVPAGRQTLLSASPLCIQDDGLTAPDTAGLPKRFAWDSVTPGARQAQSQAAVGGLDSAAANDAVRELFKNDMEQRPTPAGGSPSGFMKTMSQLPLEESLRYLVQSDLVPVRHCLMLASPAVKQNVRDCSPTSG